MLHEIVFAPLFLESRIDKERRAVLSEGQMMNTIEYRVDTALLAQLHWDNAMACRFPIGQAGQVETWSRDTLLAFHKKWHAVHGITVSSVRVIPSRVFARSNAGTSRPT